ncbi:Dyp-type peroxidase [Streptomyces sp. NPDC020858]|uniref:Dyp-type peroxidase n=1 Tax=Streptomyces sp. NPDC020858 TaxID=3365097 RepID=UPI00378F2782
MLELDDIQGLLLGSVPMPCGQYFFLTFRHPDQARAFLTRVVDKVCSAEPVIGPPTSRVHLALTCNGLRALGVDEASLQSFPEAFRVGMPDRAEELGDHGESHPDQWVGGLASSDLHALLLLFGADLTERAQRIEEIHSLIASTGVHILSELDVALPETRREHFGYQDGISRIYVEGTGIEPPPGSGPAVKPGEFVLGYPDETSSIPTLPQPEWLSRNGSFLAYRRLYEDVIAFREFLGRHADTRDEQELLAAKLLGRWRSGAPLVLAPHRDDPELVADPERNNNFNYGQMDPQGLACPIGAHIRRVNPRDTIGNIQRRRLIRWGLPYGPLLPEGSPDDGMDRGLALFFGCADLERQFEFVQKEWINAPKFLGLDHDKDPIAGDHDGTYNMTVQKKPIRKTLRGLPRFTRVRGGAYAFLPGLQALRSLAEGLTGDPSGSLPSQQLQ